MTDRRIYLPDIVGGGYKDFWSFKGRYRVCKGSRASKKSKTTALNLIYRLMKYPQANLLVVRKVFGTLKDSCYSDLKWAIHRFAVDSLFDCKLSPLEITYRPTGQKILFRGLDDPFKITSITVDAGCLCWLWIEEAYEITSEDDFDILDESIRGQVPEGLFKQATLTFNPWSDRHWLKRRFFDIESPDVLATTTNYMCNEWLDDSDLRRFEDMKQHNPRRYKVAGLGDWGVTDGLVYENWREESLDLNKIKEIQGIQSVFGLDFGYTNDPTALFCGMVDTTNKRLYVFDELYERGLSNERIAEKIITKGYRKERIRADCAEPKSIDRLRELGISHIRAARKGRDSILNGIDLIRDYEIIIDPRCKNFIYEISQYAWDKDKQGNTVNKPVDEFNHLMDAMRYGMEIIGKGEVFSFE